MTPADARAAVGANGFDADGEDVWGGWELSAPDVDDGRPYPEGAAFLIHTEAT